MHIFSDDISAPMEVSDGSSYIQLDDKMTKERDEIKGWLAKMDANEEQFFESSMNSMHSLEHSYNFMKRCIIAIFIVFGLIFVVSFLIILYLLHTI